MHVSPRSSLLQFMPQLLRNWVDKHTRLSPRNITLPTLMGQDYKSSRPIGFLKIPLSLLFIIYAFLTYFITIRPFLKKFVVVCDRYFFDLFYNLWGNVSHVLIDLLPRPAVVFLLDAPAPVAFSRMHSVEDKAISRRYYEVLRNWYLTLASRNNFFVMDASIDFEKTKKCILNHVMVFLEGRVRDVS